MVSVMCLESVCFLSRSWSCPWEFVHVALFGYPVLLFPVRVVSCSNENPWLLHHGCFCFPSFLMLTGTGWSMFTRTTWVFIHAHKSSFFQDFLFLSTKTLYRFSFLNFLPLYASHSTATFISTQPIAPNELQVRFAPNSQYKQHPAIKLYVKMVIQIQSNSILSPGTKEKEPKSPLGFHNHVALQIFEATSGNQTQKWKEIRTQCINHLGLHKQESTERLPCFCHRSTFPYSPTDAREQNLLLVAGSGRAEPFLLKICLVQIFSGTEAESILHRRGADTSHQPGQGWKQTAVGPKLLVSPESNGTVLFPARTTSS